eukprot:586169_1
MCGFISFQLVVSHSFDITKAMASETQVYKRCPHGSGSEHLLCKKDYHLCMPRVVRFVGGLEHTLIIQSISIRGLPRDVSVQIKTNQLRIHHMIQHKGIQKTRMLQS